MYGEERFSKNPDFLVPDRYAPILKGVAKAAYTLFDVPDHDYSKGQRVAKSLEDLPQPTMPELHTELIQVDNVLMHEQEYVERTRMNRIKLLGMTGVLMQFTSYAPELRTGAQTPFAHVDSLYQEIVTAGSRCPLTFAEQLEISLGQTEGDIPEALWRLFVTSRLHARWYDADIIEDIPDLKEDEIVDRMLNFSRAVRACKDFNPPYAQDSSGDTYYCWTHALGNVAYSFLAQKNGLAEYFGGKAIQNGTRLMHGLAHRFKRQHLMSDHTYAAKYGNAIGQVCVGHLTKLASHDVEMAKDMDVIYK